MTSTFTPLPASQAPDMSKERDWAYAIGLMDWEKTSIVFTKKSLIEFLKYVGVTVDVNSSNISKLPEYAKFGTLSGPSLSSSGPTEVSEPAIPTTTTTNHPATRSTSSITDDFKPTRRVREAPGGKQTDIFGGAWTTAGDDDDEAERQQRIQRRREREQAEAKAEEDVLSQGHTQAQGNFRGTDKNLESKGSSTIDAFKPTRRVREAPGGKQTDIFGGSWNSAAAEDNEEAERLQRAQRRREREAAEEEASNQGQGHSRQHQGKDKNRESEVSSTTDEFKPTRRVREAPGGKQTDIFKGVWSAVKSDEDEDEAERLRRMEKRREREREEQERKEREEEGEFGVARTQRAPVQEKKDEDVTGAAADGFKPTRRVRDAPGGHSSLSNFWGEGDEEQPQFKPTRRVREGPGGKDSINDLF